MAAQSDDQFHPKITLTKLAFDALIYKNTNLTLLLFSDENTLLMLHVIKDVLLILLTYRNTSNTYKHFLI